MGPCSGHSPGLAPLPRRSGPASATFALLPAEAAEEKESKKNAMENKRKLVPHPFTYSKVTEKKRKLVPHPPNYPRPPLPPFMPEYTI